LQNDYTFKKLCRHIVCEKILLINILDYVYNLRKKLWLKMNMIKKQNMNLTQCWNIRIYHSLARKKIKTYSWVQIINLEDDENNTYLNEVGHGNDEKPYAKTT
jgi:hypothetical protein